MSGVTKVTICVQHASNALFQKPTLTQERVFRFDIFRTLIGIFQILSQTGTGREQLLKDVSLKKSVDSVTKLRQKIFLLLILRSLF